MAEQKKIDAPKLLDGIEKEIAAFLKPWGFRRHGRTLHRFVDVDMSQAITFQLGQAYLGASHRLGVEVGIRVPECAERTFAPESPTRKFYPTSMCNIRSDLGAAEGRKASWYDLRQSAPDVCEDILRQLRETVLPAFEVLRDRAAILAHRRDYPNLDQFSHLILLEEAMMYGRQRDLAAAKARLCQYCRQCERSLQDPRWTSATQEHLHYIADLAKKLDIDLD